LRTRRTAKQFADFRLFTDGVQQPFDGEGELVARQRLSPFESAVGVAFQDAEAIQFTHGVIRPVGDGNIFGRFLSGKPFGQQPQSARRHRRAHEEAKPRCLPHWCNPSLLCRLRGVFFALKPAPPDLNFVAALFPDARMKFCRASMPLDFRHLGKFRLSR
jgi:hypothetical protein